MLANRALVFSYICGNSIFGSPTYPNHQPLGFAFFLRCYGTVLRYVRYVQYVAICGGFRFINIDILYILKESAVAQLEYVNIVTNRALVFWYWYRGICAVLCCCAVVGGITRRL